MAGVASGVEVTLADTLRLVMRALHTGALAAWLGGGLVYMLARSVLRPSLSAEAWGAATSKLRALLGRALSLLVASGAYLLFDRLTDPRIGVGYVSVLAAKLVLVAGMVWVTAAPRGLRGVRNQTTGWRDPGWLSLVLGAGAMVLGVALTLLYEAELARP